MKKKTLSILFIGNSHTYYNDMPARVMKRASDHGFDCRIAMLAHPGWYLDRHAGNPEARFNIYYGLYDYVVLQEHAHPFDKLDKYHEAAEKLCRMCSGAGSVPVIFGTWSRESEPNKQKHMDSVHRNVAEENGALLAPVGENWWTYIHSWPDIDMYDEDGEHASAAGSDFAAKMIWETILTDIHRKETEK